MITHCSWISSQQVEGVFGSSSVSVMVTAESKSDEEIPVTSKTSKMKISNIPVPVSKYQSVTTTLMSPSTSATPSTSSTVSIPIVVMPKLAILVDAYPEHLNRPGRGKDCLYQMCCFFTLQFRFNFDIY